MTRDEVSVRIQSLSLREGPPLTRTEIDFVLRNLQPGDEVGEGLVVRAEFYECPECQESIPARDWQKDQRPLCGVCAGDVGRDVSMRFVRK